MNSHDVYRAIRQFNNNHDYKLENVFVHRWEADLFSVTSSRYTHEFEVKVSRSDFLADFKKPKHHFFKTNIYKNRTSQFSGGNCPNKFWFCCPEGLISKEETPEYSGLVYAINDGYRFKVIKTAPFIHKDKFNPKEMLFNKYYWMYINQRDQLMQAKMEINELKSIINRISKVEL